MKIRTEVGIYHSGVAEDSSVPAYDTVPLRQIRWHLFILRDYDATFRENVGDHSPNYKTCNLTNSSVLNSNISQ
jgi:hypothetical protein